MKEEAKNLIQKFDFNSVNTPSYVIFEEIIEENMKVMEYVMKESGCNIMLALKCFSMTKAFPLMSKTLKGVCASGVNESRLGRENFDGEVHTYSPAFSDDDIDECAKNSNHLVFNSISQFGRYADRVKEVNPELSIGLRVNHEHSEHGAPMYDPCAPGSRMGVTIEEFDEDILDRLDGMHFHSLCEMSAEALERAVDAFEEKFGKYFDRLSWVNFGGGHWITQDGYNIDLLIEVIKNFKEKYPHLEVYMEPGEANVLNAGVVFSSVLDVTKSGDVVNAIVDTSATCHMPDIIEMPYTPDVLNAGKPGEKNFTYQLGSNTCLSGDVMGHHSFDEELKVGDRVVFLDMALYTMVKNTTFNGIKLPSIYYVTKGGEVELVREFGYEEFRGRLG